MQDVIDAILLALLCFRASSWMFHWVGLMTRAIHFFVKDKRAVVRVLKGEAEARARVEELEERRRRQAAARGA